MEVTLIATAHRELGLWNTTELYKIIERIAPDVIFEEVPPEKFDAIYNGLLSDSLETLTIKKYLQKFAVVHLPVDLNKQLDRKEIARMYEVFSMHSLEYDYLATQLGLLRKQIGFPYLNSDKCQVLFDRMLFLEQQIVQDLNLVRLTQGYKSWLKFINERENEMIENIYKYSSLNKFQRAIFLVGVEHRKAIMDKIPEFEKTNRIQLNWNFNFFK